MLDLNQFPTMERNMMFKALRKGLPINASIELLPLCNMNCDMCYVRLSKEQMDAKGRLRTKEEWLSLAGQMQDAGVLFLLLTGGEPLLYPDFKDLYIALARMGFILTINTNATLLDQKWSDFFAEYRPRRVNITLYGTNKETYRELCHYEAGFEKTIEAVRLLRERNIDVKLGMSVTKKNQSQISEFYRIGRELGVPAKIDSYMMAARRERNSEFNTQVRLEPEDAARLDIHQSFVESEEADFKNKMSRVLQMYDQKAFQNNVNKHMKCMAGGCSFTINWTGNMKPCVISPVPEIDAFEHGVEKSWQMVHDYCSKLEMSPKCINCPMQHVCPSCVVAELIEEGQRGKAPEYLCKYAKEKIRVYKEIERTGDYGILF